MERWRSATGRSESESESESKGEKEITLRFIL